MLARMNKYLPMTFPQNMGHDGGLYELRPCPHDGNDLHHSTSMFSRGWMSFITFFVSKTAFALAWTIA